MLHGYLLSKSDGTAAENQRQQLQTQAYKIDLLKYLAEAGLKKGARVLILGCGTGTEIPLILEIIGREGHMTAVDISAEQLATAKSNYQDTHVTFVKADALAFLKDPTNAQQFDFVFIRNLLIHLPKESVQELLEQVKNVVTANGIVECVEVELNTASLEPFSPAYKRYEDILKKVAAGMEQSNRGNLNLGAQLSTLFSAAKMQPQERTSQPRFANGAPEVEIIVLSAFSLFKNLIGKMPGITEEAAQQTIDDLNTQLILHPKEAFTLCFPMGYYVWTIVNQAEAEQPLQTAHTIFGSM